MKSKMVKWFVRELKLALPAMIFFTIAFNLIHFTSMIMVQPGEKMYNTYLSVTIGGLIVGKIIVIVNAFSILNRFEHRPLIISIAWKFFVYGLASFIIRIIEIVIPEYYHLHHLGQVYQQILIKLSFPLFWAEQMWLLMVLIIFVFFGEFVRIIGVGKVYAILFGSSKAQSSQEFLTR